jgi:peptidoglycan/xylan/chitin deacetylase (PgdA/CDA1 family)
MDMIVMRIRGAARWVRSHRRWAAAGAVALLVVAMIAVAVTRRSTEPSHVMTAPTDTATTGSVTTTPPMSGSITPSTIAPPPQTTSPPPTSMTPTVTPPDVPPSTVVYQGDRSLRAVALTFDAGSDAGHAAEILDILATNDITATFGMTGRFAESYPDLVARIARAGHQIVNHSYDHPSFTGVSTGGPPLPTALRTAQLQRAEAAIRAAAGVGTGGWFRPPYGDIDAGVGRDAAAAGWPTLLMWTVDSLGWKGVGADAVAARCLERAEPGAIYLFHVGRDADDAAALQRIVDGLRAAGYGFDTAEALVG